jgi:hypothetical protein
LEEKRIQKPIPLDAAANCCVWEGEREREREKREREEEETMMVGLTLKKVELMFFPRHREEFQTGNQDK